MTFSCNQCQTRYHIADEKVRGKILQVRCRSCQNLVEVKDPELAGSRAPASAASMTLLGISAIPRESSAFAKPAVAPASALPAPSPSSMGRPAPAPSNSTAKPPTPPFGTTAKPSSMPSYGQTARPSYAPPQPAKSAPLIATPASAPVARSAPSYANAQSNPITPGFTNRPAALPNTQPSKPPMANVRPPAPSPALASVAQRPLTNGAPQSAISTQPEPPPAEPKQWYYNRKGERQGPMRFSELSALIVEGSVRPEDYAWSPEIVNWKQVKDIAQFASYLPTEPPPFEAASLLPLPPKPLAPTPPPKPEPPTTPQITLPPIAAKPSTPPPVKPAAPLSPAVVAPVAPVAPVIAPTPIAQPTKPPTIVKSPIAPQPVLPMQSPSAAALQATMSQPAGPTSAASGMFAEASDPFAAVPDAADFKAASIREMSALIPISAVKPPLGKRLLIPGIAAAGVALIAALAFSFGQSSNPKTLNNKTTEDTDESQETNKIDVNGMDITGLGGTKSEDPTNNEPTPNNPTKNPKPPKKGEPSNTGAGDPIADLGTPEVKDPEAEAKAAAENAKAAALFSGKKSGVTPTLTPENKGTNEPDQAASGSEKIAMQLVGEASGSIQRCIDRALTNGEFRKETRLNVSIKTDKDGKLSSFSVGNAPANSSIEACFKGAYSRLPFKDAGGSVNLSFPVIVTPSF